MTISDWIVLGVIFLCVIGALVQIHRRKLRGGCADCSGCPNSGNCRHEKVQDQEEK